MSREVHYFIVGLICKYLTELHNDGVQGLPVVVFAQQKDFGKDSKSIAIHSCVDSNDWQRDVDSALEAAERDNFKKVVLYV